MKSSPDPRGARAWQPQEFQPPQGGGSSARPASAPEQILELFRPAQLGERRSPAGVAYQPWQPPELSALQPQERAVPTARLDEAIESAPKEPSAEELAEQLLEQARLQAEEILIQAHAEADEIIAQAQQEIETARRSAYSAGQQAAVNETRAQVAAVRQAVVQANAWREELFTQSEDLVIGLVRQMAENMFGEGWELSSEALHQNLNRVMENAKSLGDVMIFLNPADAAQLDPYWREMQASLTGSRVQIVPSKAITRGGAYVQGQMGTVDARVETQLQSVLDAMASVQAAEEARR